MHFCRIILVTTAIIFSFMKNRLCKDCFDVFKSRFILYHTQFYIFSPIFIHFCVVFCCVVIVLSAVGLVHDFLILYSLIKISVIIIVEVSSIFMIGFLLFFLILILEPVPLYLFCMENVESFLSLQNGVSVYFSYFTA